jgi:hypothetical protein
MIYHIVAESRLCAPSIACMYHEDGWEKPRPVEAFSREKENRRDRGGFFSINPFFSAFDTQKTAAIPTKAA